MVVWKIRNYLKKREANYCHKFSISGTFIALAEGCLLCAAPEAVLVGHPCATKPQTGLAFLFRSLKFIVC
jgi:hypothetical protein